MMSQVLPHEISIANKIHFTQLRAEMGLNNWLEEGVDAPQESDVVNTVYIYPPRYIVIYLHNNHAFPCLCNYVKIMHNLTSNDVAVYLIITNCRTMIKMIQQMLQTSKATWFKAVTAL
jgi:hypothetical protein